MALKFRPHEPEDLEAMKEMWSRNTDWGTEFEAIFNNHILHSALDGACMLLAIEESNDEVVGQFAFIPYLVHAGNKTLRAFRPAAPIVSKSYRYFKVNPLDHPVIQMYFEGVKLLQARGEELIFMVPNPSWLRLLRIFPQLRTGSFPLFSRTLSNERLPPLPSGVCYGQISPADPRVNDLWDRFRSLHSCSVVRDTRILPWKVGKGDHDVMGIERSGDLIALLALRNKGHKQWLVDDLIFADCEDSLRAVMTVALHTAQAASASKDLEKVGVLATPAMQCALESVGFKQDTYNFPLVVHPLAEGLSTQEIDPRRWFLSAND